MSSSMEMKKMGILIFVGNAARFVTNAMPMAEIVITQKSILLPVSMIINKVSGVTRQPCPAIAMANQPNRSSSWFLHQVIKRTHRESLLAVYVNDPA